MKTYSKREIKNELRRQLKQYEVAVGDITPEERKALRKWVADGNSVYDNPFWLAGEDGNSLCFIVAIRLVVVLKYLHN
jgi:hypothetical protein